MKNFFCQVCKKGNLSIVDVSIGGGFFSNGKADFHISICSNNACPTTKETQKLFDTIGSKL